MSGEIVSLSRSSYYAVLDVSSDASVTAISKAYKKQALRFHPDKNSSPSAEAAMRVVNQAFEVLSDPLKRDWYDFHGSPADGKPPASNSGSGDNCGGSVGKGRTATGIDENNISDQTETTARSIDAQFDAYIKSVPRKDVAFRKQMEPSSTTTAVWWHCVTVFAMVWAFAISMILIGGSGGCDGGTKMQQSYTFSPEGKLSFMEHWTHGQRIPFYTDGKFQASQYPVNSAVRQRIEASVEAHYRQELLQKCVDEKVEMESIGSLGASKACLQLELLFTSVS